MVKIQIFFAFLKTLTGEVFFDKYKKMAF